MNAEKYLNQIVKLDTLIKYKFEELEKLQSMAEYRGINYEKISVREKGPVNDIMAECICAKSTLENSINEKISELYSKRQDIISDLELLDDPNIYAVMYEHYINNLSFESIGYKLDKSKSWAVLQHKKGIAFIQDLLDSRQVNVI